MSFDEINRKLSDIVKEEMLAECLEGRLEIISNNITIVVLKKRGSFAYSCHDGIKIIYSDYEAVLSGEDFEKFRESVRFIYRDLLRVGV